MKNVAVVLFCIGLCIAIALVYPQVGTSNPMVDATGCLVSGCHDAGFGDGTLHGTHTGLACDVCHESPSGGGTVDSSTCLACHPAEDSELCDLALAHPEAGCLAMGCHADCEVTEGCEVTIDCADTELCPDDECTTCEATTVCDGEPAEGVYSWSLNGAAATGDNGSIEICPDDLNDGDNTLMVTDTANDDAEDTESITLLSSDDEKCDGGGGDCSVTVGQDSYPKSNWIPLPALIVIQTTGLDLPLILPPANVTFDCAADENGILSSIVKTGNFVLNGTIWQTALIWPALLTGNFGGESETCTVTVAGCDETDTFELNILSVGGIPLSE